MLGPDYYFEVCTPVCTQKPIYTPMFTHHVRSWLYGGVYVVSNQDPPCTQKPIYTHMFTHHIRSWLLLRSIYPRNTLQWYLFFFNTKKNKSKTEREDRERRDDNLIEKNNNNNNDKKRRRHLPLSLSLWCNLSSPVGATARASAQQGKVCAVYAQAGEVVSTPHIQFPLFLRILYLSLVS